MKIAIQEISDLFLPTGPAVKARARHRNASAAGFWAAADVEIIRPEGGTNGHPESVKVMEGENGFGWGPLAMASFPA